MRFLPVKTWEDFLFYSTYQVCHIYNKFIIKFYILILDALRNVWMPCLFIKMFLHFKVVFIWRWWRTTAAKFVDSTQAASLLIVVIVWWAVVSQSFRRLYSLLYHQQGSLLSTKLVTKNVITNIRLQKSVKRIWHIFVLRNFPCQTNLQRRKGKTIKPTKIFYLTNALFAQSGSVMRTYPMGPVTVSLNSTSE